MNKALEIAFTQYGVYEYAEGQNPEVMKFFHEIGQTWVQDDETAWCSAFVNWCCMKAGLPYTKKLNARSWLEIGEPILPPIERPRLGDIVIFWRIAKDSEYGHVAFYINQDKDYVYVLGGNQSNQVNVSRYPVSQLLEYRRLI